MRVLSPEAAAALQRSPLPLAVLVDMALSPPLRLNTGGVNLTLGGLTYLGASGLGQIGAVQDSPGEARQLQFELQGVTSDAIARMLLEPVQGKAVTISLAIFDPDTYQVLDVQTRWTGLLDVMSLADSSDGAAVQVTAEHAGIDLLRSRVSLYSDDEQQRLQTGDRGLQYMVSQAEMRIVWPAASWGRQ